MTKLIFVSDFNHDFLHLYLQNEVVEKLKMFKAALERTLRFLGLNKHDIQLIHKGKLLSVEKHINFFLSPIGRESLLLHCKSNFLSLPCSKTFLLVRKTNQTIFVLVYFTFEEGIKAFPSCLYKGLIYLNLNST